MLELFSRVISGERNKHCLLLTTLHQNWKMEDGRAANRRAEKKEKKSLIAWRQSVSWNRKNEKVT